MPILIRNEIVKTESRHLTRIQEAVAVAPDPQFSLPTELRYGFICFVNRCGSNLVAETLASGGQLNLAGEVFNWPMVKAACEKQKLANFRQYFSLVARRQAVNGVFLAKVAVAQLVLLKKAGILDEILPQTTFILVERADKLAQAVSLAIAGQTLQWTSYEKPETIVEPEFRFASIRAILVSIIRHMAYFDEIFALNGLEPVQINYEQFVADPAPYVKFVAQRLGLPELAIDPGKIRTQKQANALNQAWREQFLHDLATRRPKAGDGADEAKAA